jgi:hypothetical protein
VDGRGARHRVAHAASGKGRLNFLYSGTYLKHMIQCLAFRALLEKGDITPTGRDCNTATRSSQCTRECASQTGLTLIELIREVV